MTTADDPRPEQAVPSSLTAGPTRCVALLRGVNVGVRRVDMGRLREVTAELGCTDVTTYLNSGNVLLASPLPAAELEAVLTRSYSDAFGFEIPTLVRSLPQLVATLARAPFPDGDPSQVTVHFVSGAAPADLRERLERNAAEPERVHVPGDDPVTEFFVDFAGGLARSKLANRMARIVQPGTATARNMRTLATIVGLLAGASKAGFGPAVADVPGEADG